MFKKSLKFLVLALCALSLAAGLFLHPSAASPLPVKGYEGVCELWQVDLFEGGQSSRAAFLKARAAAFSQKNPGNLVLVRAMTADEALKNLSLGRLPDLISASAGLLSLFLPYLMPYPGCVRVRDDVLAAGTISGELLALPWAMGGYALFAKEQTVQEAGLDEAAWATQPLSSALTPAKGRLLSVGRAAYNNPFIALRGLTERVDFGPELTQLAAYEAFVGAQSALLLGTQRDLVRLSNRMAAGKSEALVMLPISGFTDLVTAVGLCRGEGSAITAAAFAEELTGDDVQQKLNLIGLYSVTGVKVYSQGWPVQMQQALSGRLTVTNLFTQPESLLEAVEKSKAALSGAS